MENDCLLLEEEEKGQSWQKEHPTGRGSHVLGDSRGPAHGGYVYTCVHTHMHSGGIRLRNRAEASQGH